MDNPSFEGFPKCCNPPFYWSDCGAFVHETPPDVHPDGIFQVNYKPFHESTYLGTVVRDINTWESVSTQTPDFMKSGLLFLQYLSGQIRYLLKSFQKNPDKREPHIIPAILRVSGSNGKTKDPQLLAKSSPVRHLFWKKYQFIFRPEHDFDILILEAMYAQGSTPYNSHILLDLASDLLPVECSAN